MAAASSLPILHGSNVSPYVRKVRVALAYKGIPYDDVQQVPFGAPPEYVARSPLSKIPCWEEGELILPDSSVILGYLEHKHPDPPLLPVDPATRARALWFEEYADTLVSVAVAGVFFERFVKPAVFKQETNEAVVEAALTGAIPKILDYLTGCLGDDEYMVGGAFSLADIAITSSFVNFGIAGERVDEDRWPGFAAYVQRVHALPCYAPIVKGDWPGAA
jgi:glutathione S-transferase